MQPAVFTAVPFDERWITHDKCDVHAIYRRPILDDVGEQQLDAHGVPLWDLTGGLPVRRHHDWTRKGFEYVTLADVQSLRNKVVVQGLVEQGLKPADFIMLRNRVAGASPWNAQLYLASQSTRDRSQADHLTRLVESRGSDAVRDVMRLTNPTFELPVHLRGIEPGGQATMPAAAVPVTTPAQPPGTVLPRVAKHSLAGRQRRKAARKAVGAPQPPVEVPA